MFEKGNAGKLAKRDTGFVFHFPAFYTTPITSYREGDYKLMRQLNTGEVKLFNVAEDMGESKELSKEMPEKTEEMIRKLNAYLRKVDAWTMKEVYDTRQEELDEWIDKDKLRISANRKKLEGQNLKASERQKLKSEMESSLQNLKRHEKNIEELKAQRIIERWF